MNRTIYVRDADVVVWDLAKKAAASRGVDMSQVVMAGIRNWLDTVPACTACKEPLKDADKFCRQCGKPTGQR